MASLVTCAARDGHAMCWGDRQLLGNGKEEIFPGAALPSPVKGIDDAVGVAAGIGHGCILRRGGTVACWGAGSGDNFGVGPSPASQHVRAPLPVTGIADAEQLVAGGGHTCARTRAGRVLCWGENDHGETSQPVTSGRAVVAVPTAVEGLDDADALTTGEHRTCARRKSGEIACWGTSTSALSAPCAPGEGCSSRDKPAAEQSAILEAGRKPTAIPELRGALEIAAADDFVCGRMATGEIVCTGQDTVGVLGDGKTEKRFRTVRVPGIVGARRISVSWWAACAIDDTGRVLCWGSGPVVGPGPSGTPRVIDGVADAVEILRHRIRTRFQPDPAPARPGGPPRGDPTSA